MNALANIKSTDDAELIEELAAFEARESFWAFRQFINPKLIKGWWQREVAHELQRFYHAWRAGQRPKLVLMAPPQHGKTTQVTDFLSWIAGKHPDARSMFASYADNLGVGVNMAIQRTLELPRYKRAFPDTYLYSGNVPGEARWIRNSDHIEFVGHSGSFRNTTVEGKINGFGLDLGVIDDPMKGRNEAQSLQVRNRVWSWFTDDFFGRFSDEAGMLMIMTRWHVDDPIGRFIDRVGKDLRVLCYPAIATKDERYRKKGEALFPEHKSLEFLLERKSVLTQAGWESLYQQNPIIAGGELFPIEKFTQVRAVGPKEVRKSVRYWDKAGTKGGGAYTAGVLMHELKVGGFVVSDVRRGQWSAREREQRLQQTAEIDRAQWGNVETWIEQEPGSGGKESAERTIHMLRGFTVHADRPTGNKYVRAEPYAAQVQASNVALVVADWNRDFLDEHEAFPNGKYKDQVDAAAGAFAKVTERKTGSYDDTMSWVG